MMCGDEASIVAQMRISRWKTLGVIIGRGCGWTFRIIHERTLQLVGNHAELITTHMQERVNTGFDSYLVGRCYKFAVRDQTHLMSVGDDPLRIGCGEIVAEPKHLGSQFLGIHKLPQRILGTQFNGAWSLPQFLRPSIVARSE